MVIVLITSFSRDAMYCDQLVCILSVCTSTSITLVRTSPNFLYMLHMAIARSFSDDNAICYVFLIV